MSEMTAKADLPACPVETTLTLIGDKWKVLILRDLMPGTKRFGELKKSVGNVSQKVLTAQLRAMEENGLVHREVYAEVPPRVEYSLTVNTTRISNFFVETRVVTYSESLILQGFPLFYVQPMHIRKHQNFKDVFTSASLYEHGFSI